MDAHQRESIIMYLTLREAAAKYRLSVSETDRFMSLLYTEFSHLVFGNPDISASHELDTHIIKAEQLPPIMRKVLAKGDEKSDAVIAGLRTNAVTAVATWLSEANKSGHVDYTVDMRLEDDGADMERRHFCTDDDTVSDLVAELDVDIASLVRLLQKN